MIKVTLVRHGETEWSLSGRHTGRSDIPLTPRGEANAARLQGRLADSSPVLVLSSPLQRARRTCELAGFGDRMQIDPDLAEWDYGQYEGRKTADIHQELPDWSLFRDGCPGGETAEDVGRRADRVIARVRAVDGDAILFAHGHLLRVLAARWVSLPAESGSLLLLAPASVSILSYEHSLTEPAIALWNDGRA
jgi:broad specificity phosphatase PhoE